MRTTGARSGAQYFSELPIKFWNNCRNWVGSPSIVGSDPTTIRARAWPIGQAEPAGWQVTVVDWSGALQGAGAVGLGWRLDATADQVVTVRHAGLSADVLEEAAR